MALSDSHFDAGYEAMRNMDYETAESEFKVALTYKHDHTKTLLHYGLLLQSRKDFTGAVDMWKVGADAMLKNRHHVKMLCNLSIVLTKVLGDHDAAEKYFKAALECDKDHVGVLVNYGLFLCTIREEYEKAELMLKRAIKADPTRKKINNCGYLLQELLSRQIVSRPVTNQAASKGMGMGNRQSSRRRSTVF